MGIRQSTTFKLKAVERALNRTNNERLEDIAQQFNIGYSTLTRWMSAARQNKLVADPGDMLAREKRPRDWTTAEKFQAIVDTAAFSEQERGRYCREKGLFQHQIEQWKQALMSQASPSKTDKLVAENRTLKQANKQLHRDLQRKEKALAVAAALLILKKKAQALFDSDEDN